MRSIVPTLILLSVAAGCASAPPKAKAPRQLPEPATFRITGTLTANLTPQLMAQTGLPQTIKVSLEANARSEALSAEPLRSRHEGHMKLTLTDGEGKQSLANVDISVGGDSDGSPTEGLGQAITRYLDAASMMARPIPQSGGPAR
ncbi:hypothetical protein [Humisphaera borealis]|uniref:Lipoprotein n=1 Tax=Humisphaera borealis TaxID=2807512 RepID=A0A7M2WVC8_9BACT|nr:hypothetical protein [Humisphaera borealis]QOV89507.1 hypothetical protein IPV69_25490 [Humisphaera borealis]